MRRVALIPLLVFLPLLPACSDESSSGDEDTDTGTDPDTGTDADSDSDGDTDTGTETSLACPEPIADECDYSADDLPAFLEAEQIAVGMTFAKLAHKVVIGERPEGDDRVVVLVRWDGDLDLTWGVAELLVPQGSSLSPAGVGWDAEGSVYLPSEAVAVLCDEDHCALYGADPVIGSTVELLQWDNGQVPGETAVNGLWIPQTPDRVCVFGTGISCFDGAFWTTMVEPWSEAPAINDVATWGNEVMAVGDSGLVVTSGFPEWNYSYGSTYPDFLSVAFADDCYLIGAADGTLRMSDLSGACPLTDEGIFSIEAMTAWDEYLRGVTESGLVFSGRGEIGWPIDFCFTGEVIDPPLAALHHIGGIADNYMVLTESTLYGTDFFAID